MVNAQLFEVVSYNTSIVIPHWLIELYSVKSWRKISRGNIFEKNKMLPHDNFRYIPE